MTSSLELAVISPDSIRPYLFFLTLKIVAMYFYLRVQKEQNSLSGALWLILRAPVTFDSVFI